MGQSWICRGNFYNYQMIQPCAFVMLLCDDSAFLLLNNITQSTIFIYYISRLFLFFYQKKINPSVFKSSSSFYRLIYLLKVIILSALTAQQF